MDKKILFRILQVTVGLVLLIVCVLFASGINPFSLKGVTKIPTIVSIVVLFWGFYFSIGWKWPYLRKLVYKENLNGTWFGTYTSRNFITNEVFKDQIAVVIRQSFVMLNVKSHTANYINHSYGETLNYDTNSDTHQLIYLYSQSIFKPVDDNARKGTSELQLNYNCDKEELYGNFWTNHNSKGFLNLTKITKTQVKSFNEALKHLNN
jgi:hypothetical protein